MAVPTNKADLLRAMTENFRKLDAELASVSPAEAEQADMEGHAKGTVMSVNDLVAYLGGWGELVLKWIRIRAEGLEPDFPETGFQWNELGRLAQKFYRDQAGMDFSARLDRLRTSHDSLVALVQSLSDDELYGHAWYERWTLGRMIQFNTASPYANARARLVRWKKVLRAR